MPKGREASLKAWETRRKNGTDTWKWDPDKLENHPGFDNVRNSMTEEEYSAQMAKNIQGAWDDSETREMIIQKQNEGKAASDKMGQGMKGKHHSDDTKAKMSSSHQEFAEKYPEYYREIKRNAGLASVLSMGDQYAHCRPDVYSRPEVKAERILLDIGWLTEHNQKVRDEDGRLVAIVDFAILGTPVILEVDSWYHDPPARQARDRERQSRLEDLGKVVVRIDEREKGDWHFLLSSRIEEALACTV